jgi:hypothetical protein
MGSAHSRTRLWQLQKYNLFQIVTMKVDVEKSKIIWQLKDHGGNVVDRCDYLTERPLAEWF